MFLHVLITIMIELDHKHCIFDLLAQKRHDSFQSEAGNFRLQADRSKGCLSKDFGFYLINQIRSLYQWDNWHGLGRVWDKLFEGEDDICVRQKAKEKKK